MNKIPFLCMVCVLMVAAAAYSEESQPKEIQIRWTVDAIGGAEATRGVSRVAVAQSDCLEKFTINGISTWMTAQTSKSGITDVRSGVRFSIRKLFPGKSPYPEITILQSTDDVTTPVTYSFKETQSLRSEAWPAANNDFSETFDGMELGRPDGWSAIQLHCRE